MKKTTIFLLTALLLAGCSTTKQTTTHQKSRAKQAQIDPTSQLLDQVIEAQPAFTSMQANKVRFKIDFQQHTYTINGSVSMIADSMIIFSLQPLLNIELYRAEITPKHITLIDKMNRKYVRLNYEELQKQTGINATFNDIQAIGMNRLFVMGVEQTALKELNPNIDINDNAHLFCFTDQKFKYNFTVDKQNLQLINTNISKQNTDFSATVNYLNHNVYSDTVYPAEMQISFQTTMIGACTISFIQLEFNKNVNATPLNISKYSATSLSSLIK